MSRRETIEAMLAEDPQDVFLRYSLAMEMRSEGDRESSLRLLAALTQEEPPHVASFFMAAQQLVELEQVDEARSYLNRGIQQAQAQGDAHAAAEMNDLLLTLDDGEL